MYVYYSPYGGAVLAALDQRDEEYERQLFRGGTEYRVLRTEGALTAAQIAGAAVRGGKVEVS